jgi:hypothetical protein
MWVCASDRWDFAAVFKESEKIRVGTSMSGILPYSMIREGMSASSLSTLATKASSGEID